MSEYKLIPTSLEVVSVIRARHGNELTVFGSFSDPTGTENGGSGETSTMMTLWGFPDADYPLFQVTTKRTPPKSDNAVHQCFLCAPIREES